MSTGGAKKAFACNWEKLGQLVCQKKRRDENQPPLEMDRSVIALWQRAGSILRARKESSTHHHVQMSPASSAGWGLLSRPLPRLAFPRLNHCNSPLLQYSYAATPGRINGFLTRCRVGHLSIKVRYMAAYMRHFTVASTDPSAKHLADEVWRV
jgi:hypothetical protein